MNTWRDRQPTLAAKLRAILADGEWHSSTELVAKVGHRFGESVA